MEDLQSAALSDEAESPEIGGGKTWSIWLLGLLLLAFALRILLLDEQSIWWDEGISLHLALSTLSELLIDRLSNIHPPLYFILLKGWLSLAGVSAFSARYLSVLASWLQIAVIYAVAQRWFSRRTAAAAGLLAALSAVSILYAQEIRVYALLALIYLLLLAVTGELTRSTGVEGKARTKLWVFLGLTTLLGLHLHYLVIFVAGYVSIWALAVFTRQRRWADFRRWLLVMYLVGLASLPWFLAAVRNWTMVRSEAIAGTFVTEPAPISFLLSQVWVFHLTGLAGALARPGVSPVASVAVIVLLLLVLLRLGQKGTRRDTAFLLANWLIPLSSALVVWTVRSFSHPRYVSMFAPGLILLAAYAAFPPKERIGKHLRWLGRLLSPILILTVVAASILGLWLYFIVPGVAKDDVRGVARFLEREAKAGDLILVPDTDWSLPFEYRGEASVEMPGLDDPQSKWPNLTALSTGIQRVFLLDYQHGTRDWQELLPFALEKAGTKMLEKEFDGLLLRSFTLDEMMSGPEMDSEEARFGPLELTGSWIEQDAFAGNGLALALRWRLAESMDEDAQISLRLLDEAGLTLARKDAMLLDAQGRPSTHWPVGDFVTTYHVLAIPPAVPPLAYDLQVQAYIDDGTAVKPLNLLDDQGAPVGQATIIGKTHVTYKETAGLSGQANLPILPWDKPVQMSPSLTLLAAELAADRLIPGQSLNVQLLWQAAADQMPDLRPEVVLSQGNKDLVVNGAAPQYGKYPTDIWVSGEQVFERRDLLIPPDAGGSAEVVLRLDNEELLLGEVEIVARDHSFIQPETDYVLDATFGDIARLSGFDLPQTTFTAAETIPVTLFWQSLIDGSEIDYVVFAHLLADDGHLIAQHDGPPAGGSQPTTGWLGGEYINDAHDISLQTLAYRGPARIEIGFYNPANGERLMLSDGSDQLVLPVILTIEP